MSLQSVGFAVIGYGHIGRRHADMIIRHPEARLVAVADTDAAIMMKDDAQDVPLFASLEAFLQSPEAAQVSVVTIATPNSYHAAQSLLCLEYGKHIVIEKPLSLNKGDAEKVITKALQVHRHVFAVMQNRYSPPAAWMKELVASGKLGNIYMVQLNCYWNRDARYYKPGSWHGKKDLDGGTLFTQFSHFIDMLYWLFGDIRDIHARMMNNNHPQLIDFEDSGFVSFGFVNGGIGCINFSTSVWDKNLESSMIVIAEKGSVKISGQYMDQVEYCHVKDYTLPDLATMDGMNSNGHYKGAAANHHYIIENVIDVLKGQGDVHVNALEALKVVDIIERIYRSALGQRADTTQVPLKTIPLPPNEGSE